MMAADDSLAAFDAAQSWGDAMKALNRWREKAENTPPEVPGGPVSDEQSAPVSVEGSSPENARMARYADALTVDLDAAHAFTASHSSRGSFWGCTCGEAFADRHGHARHVRDVQARAAIAIADEEQAQIKAETDRLGPADGPQWRDRGAIIATLTFEVEQLMEEVVRTNDRFAKARVRNWQLRARAEAAERARDEALAREARLREAVEALADEVDGWTPYDSRDTGETFLADSVREFVTDLRALLAAQEPPAASEHTPTEQGEAWICDGCMSTASASEVAEWADYEHVLCIKCASPARTSGATEDGGE